MPQAPSFPPDPSRARPTPRPSPAIRWLAFREALARIGKVLANAVGVRAVLLVWLLVSGLSGLGLLEAFDRAIYDGFARIGQPAAIAPKVLLVSVPQAGGGREVDFAVVCRRLVEAGVVRVAVLFPLTDAEIEQMRRSACSPRLVIGVLIPEDPAGQLQAATRAEQLVQRGLVVGASRIGDQSEQVRERWTSYQLGASRYPALEILAATGSGPLAVGSFVPDLRFAADQLPAITAQRIEDEGIVPELGAGKIALIGYASNPFLQSLSVPGHSEAMSLLRYEGLVINAVVEKATLFSPGPVLRIGMLGVIAVLMAVVLQPLPLRSGVALFVVLILGELAVSGGLLAFLATWPPLAELLMLQIGLFLGVYRSKAATESRQLKDLLSSTSGKLQRRTRPANVLQTNEYWAFIARLVDQTLHLNRTIFLERVPGDHRVKEIIALRCSVSDIDEMRRDYERTPYTTAIAAGGAIEVERYLSAVATSERQFLVPLVFGGEVMGFWAFGIEEHTLARIPDLHGVVNQIADQVATLLYQRKVWKEKVAQHNSSWDRFFEDSNFAAYRELNQSVLLMEQRLSSLEHIFAAQSSAAILYDLFGRVVLLNQRMSELLAPAGIAPYKLTLTDFVTAVTGHPVDEIRTLVRYLIIDQLPISLPVTLPSHPEHRFVLKGQALRFDDGETEEAGTPSPFSLGGVLVELVDVSEAQWVANLKSDLVAQIGHKLANKLEGLLLATDILHSDDLPADQRNFAVETMRSSVDAACGLVRHVQVLLESGAGAADQAAYPVDPIRILMQAVRELTPELDRQRLKFSPSLPDFPTLVIAAANELRSLFSIIVRFLAADAVSASSLNLTVVEEELRLSFLFTNEGFGIPSEKLQEYLETESDNALSDIFREIRQMRHVVAAWGGELDFSSNIGRGMQASLVLNTFWGQVLPGDSHD